MKKQERIKEAVHEMRVNSDKYCNLVWYGRANPDKHEGDVRKSVLDGIETMEKLYPKETSDFNTEGQNDFWHGFNSGMLAASRLYLEMIEGDVEFALENFPELDT